MLRILGRPTLLAFRSDHTGTTDTDTGTVDTGTVDGGGAADVADISDVGDVGDAAVDLTPKLTPKMVELLAYLAVHPHGVRRDTIVATLWPDTARPRPANNLSALITRLRAALPTCSTGPAPAAQRPRSSQRTPAGTSGLVATAGDRYLLDPGQVSVDYWAFLAVTNGAATEQVGREPLDEGRLEALHTAHELYAGPLADGLDGEWVLSVREAARRSFLAATARLVRHHVQDAPTIALRLLEKARNLDPANEDLYRDIMALQLRAGDKHAAANTLRLLEAQLADIDEVLSGPVAELAKNIHLPDQE